ncbi:hypothetical protein C0J52_25762 [Blattella germanica]|nr:hypothetical protein C0J52_25762 [Blattella germanica]
MFVVRGIWIRLGIKQFSNGTELSEKQDLYYRKLVNMQNGILHLKCFCELKMTTHT